MAIVKISKDCLINQDQDSITLNLPDDLLTTDSKSIDYDKIAQVRGLLKSHTEAKKRFQEIRKQYGEKVLSDSVELLREDRQRG